MAVALLAGAGAAQAEPTVEIDREELRQMLRQLLLEDPGMIVEALQKFEADQRLAAEQARKDAIGAYKERLQSAPGDPVLGNPDGDVVMVEFFDYNCGYCRQVADPLRQAVLADGQVKLVMKEWPILGPPSYFAARAALAAEKQGLYEPFHFALMESKERVDEDMVLAIAADVGLDLTRLQADMLSPQIDAKLQETYDLAEAVGITGTPAFVIGDQLLPGAVTMSRLQQVIAEERGGN